MTAHSQGLVLTITGLAAVRLVLSGGYLWFLKPGMRVPLLVAGSIVVLLGLLTVGRALRQTPEEEPSGSCGLPDTGGDGEAHGEAHGHAHHGAPRIAWALLAPVLILLIVEPAPLGSYAVERDQRQVEVPSRGGMGPLAGSADDVVDLSHTEVILRARDEPDTLSGRVVRLTGFVVAGPADDGFVLARFSVSCCAGDAVALRVRVVTSEPVPPVETWVTVEGLVREPGVDEAVDEATQLGVPTVLAETVTVVPMPAEPYE